MGFIERINDVLWGPIMLFLLLGTEVYFTIILRFIQVRKFGASLRQVFKSILTVNTGQKGSMSSFQALAAAVAARIGTGTIAGMATAVTSGGPGAVFWMWVSAFFSMATSFAEAVLGQKFKENHGNEITGGPVYYIEKGTGQKWMAVVFAISTILALGIMGNMVQSNSMAGALNKAFKIPERWAGVFVIFAAAFVISGGIRRIATVLETLVPFIVILYITGSLIIVLTYSDKIIPSLRMIITGAFHPGAISGGAAGVGVQQAFRYGSEKELFFNDASMVSTSHAHAIATVGHPVEQGLAAIFAVFVDTVIVCSMSALVIITTGVLKSGMTGTALVQEAFSRGFGMFGGPFFAMCLFFFSFSTLIGWYFFGESNVKYLFGSSAIIIYRIAVFMAIILGTTLKLPKAMAITSTFNALMTAPNLISILLLSGVVIKLLSEFDQDFEHKNKK